MKQKKIIIEHPKYENGIVTKLHPAGKAYDNEEFIHSRDGRTIRILAEYLYPEQYFRKHGIRRTIVFYGSARTLPLETYTARVETLKKSLAESTEESRPAMEAELKKLLSMADMTKCYEDAVVMAEKFSNWSMTLPKRDRFYICTGGGPGMMEAANRGAAKAGAPNIGLNISLPFEQYPNFYITPDLNFEFHYFFMRKYWFVYLTKAIIAMPGGFGTLDELFEILTLKQTLKVTKPLPIVLYNESFWRNLINFDYLVETGMINEQDLNLFKFANTPDEVFNYIKDFLSQFENVPERGAI